MSLSRRRFVRAATLSLLAGAAAPFLTAQSLSAAQDTFSPGNLTILGGLSKSDFDSLIGERFTVSSGHRKLDSLRLISVNETKPTPAYGETPGSTARLTKTPRQTVTGFTLRFAGSAAPLPQDTYTVENGNLGRFALFLVPSGPGAPANTYTATFSYLAAPADR